MRPFPWKCGSCRERAVVEAILPSYETEMEHDGRKYAIQLSDLKVPRCENCGTIGIDEEAGERLNDALRAAAGLLAPSEIRAHRKRLKLTQEQLAELLRINVSTLSRWETGAQMQQRTLDAFLRVVFQFPDVRRFLGGVRLMVEASEPPLRAHLPRSGPKKPFAAWSMGAVLEMPAEPIPTMRVTAEKRPPSLVNSERLAS